jgi:hypothetical protein
VRNIVGKSLITVGAVLSLSTVVFAGPAQAQQADPVRPSGQCGQSEDPTTNWSSAHWDIGCQNGAVTVSGWVQHDGGSGCSKVKAVFEGQITESSDGSCGFWGGDKVYFNWTHPGSIADAYLMDYEN